MFVDIETNARLAIAEWTDRGDEMSLAEFRHCIRTVLAHSDEQARTSSITPQMSNAHRFPAI